MRGDGRGEEIGTHGFLQVGLVGLDGGGEEAGEAVRQGGLDVGRPRLRSLVAQDHVALVELHRPGQLLLPELRPLESELQVRIRRPGGDAHVRRIGRRQGLREGSVAGGGGGTGGVGHDEAERKQ
jgi:hypothetical protein